MEKRLRCDNGIRERCCSLRVTWMERIKNEFIRGTVCVICFGDEAREDRLGQ